MTDQTDLLAQIKALILDMDGVLWRDQAPIGDLPAIFASIQRKGQQFIMATNNASRSPRMYVEKLRGFGVEVSERQILNSAQVAAAYLHARHPQGGPVYILGEAGLIEALQECGFYPSAENPLAVVVAMDRSFNYEKLRTATLLIRAGAPFLAANPDKTYPIPEGLGPGAGALAAALEAATDVKPIFMGKPSPEIYRMALERLGVEPRQALVVGDRPETDIAGAQALGCPCALVLSGVTGPEAAERWRPAPEIIAPDLASVVAMLP